jgi:hypothetical protein
MNRRVFCACDLQWRKLQLVDLDGRADCIRDVNSIALRVRIVFNLRNGRKFLWCALFRISLIIPTAFSFHVFLGPEEAKDLQ